MPRDDAAVLVDGAVFPDVRSVAVYGFDAVSVKIQDCSVEVAGFRASSGWASVGATASYQCCGIEVPDRGRAGSGEGNVCGTSFYATPAVSCGVYDGTINCGSYPGVSWQRKKSALWMPRPIWWPDSPM